MEEPKTPGLKIEKRDPLARIGVGYAIFYERMFYKVVELPSEQNKYRYILKTTDNKTTMRVGGEQLKAVLENGQGVLVPPAQETTPSPAEPTPPVIPAQEKEAGPIAWCRICEKPLMAEAEVHRTQSTVYCAEHVPKIPLQPPTPEPEPAKNTPSRRERMLVDIKGRMERRALEIATLKEALEKLQKESPSTPAPTEAIKTPDVEVFPNEMIRDRIKALLSSSDQIKIIRSIEVVDTKEGDMKLIVKVVAGPINSEILVSATLTNNRKGIEVKNYSIEGSMMIKRIADNLLAPKLKEISSILVEYIEKEQNKKIDKIQIENGKLKVTYK